MVASGQLNDEIIVDAAFAALFAAQETTLRVLVALLHNLAENKEAGDAVYEELQGVLAQNNEDVLASMPHSRGAGSTKTYAAIMATLWRSPPVPGTLRVATKETTVSGTTIPAGSLMQLNFCEASRLRDGKSGTMPFEPKRFENDSEMIRLAMQVGFGAGLKTCPGQNMALQWLSLVLLHLVKAGVRCSAQGPFPSLVAGLTMRPSGPVYLNT